MIQTVTIPNYSSINILQQTRLTADTAEGATSLPVQNSANFNGHYVAVGNLGSDTTEIVAIGEVSGATTIPLADDVVTKIKHFKYDYVTELFGSQVVLYKAPNVDGTPPDDSAYVPVTSPTDIEADKSTTSVDDPDGGADYWYKFTYYDPVADVETDLADSKTGRGGGNTNYCSIDAIRNEAGFNNAPYITDPMIEAKRLAAQKEIDATLSGIYTVPFQQPINEFISDITIRLAAGLLLLQQYSSIRTQRTVDGEEKVNSARLDLQNLKLKNTSLTDENGNTSTLPGGATGVGSWPNSLTPGTRGESGGAPRIFRMSDIQGYRGRKF